MKETSVISVIMAATKILNTKEVLELPDELNTLLESYIEEYGETHNWKFSYFNTWDLIKLYPANEAEEVSVQLYDLINEVKDVEMFIPLVFFQNQSKLVYVCSPKLGFVYGE